MGRNFYVPYTHPLEQQADQLIKETTTYNDRYAGLVKTTRTMREDDAERRRIELSFEQYAFSFGAGSAKYVGAQGDQGRCEKHLAWRPPEHAQPALFDIESVLPQAGLTEQEERVVKIVLLGGSATYDAPRQLGKSVTACAHAYRKAVEKIRNALDSFQYQGLHDTFLAECCRGV